MKRSDYPSSRRSLPWLALLFAALPLAAQVRDLYLVTDAKAELYQNRQRVAFTLAAGDIVEGETHPTYRGWLLLTIGGQAYDVRNSHFLSRTASRETYARQRAETLARSERNSERIASDRDRVWQLQSAVAAILFDSTVQFREEIQVLVPPPPVPPDNRPGRPRPPPARPVYRTEYRYTDKIATSRARREARRWQDEIDTLLAQVERAGNERREDLARLAAADIEYQIRERRFRFYEITRGGRYAEPHLVLAKTQLFDGKALVAELQPEEVVFAQPNERHSRWLRVQVPNGQVLDGRAEDFAPRSKIETDDAVRLARLQQLAADLEGEIDLAVSQENQLRSLCLALRYESQITRLPLAGQPFAADYAGRRFYAGSAAPNNTVEIINDSRARTVLRDWERDLDSIQKTLARLRQRLESARVEAAVTEAKVRERTRRFQDFESPGPQLPPPPLP